MKNILLCSSVFAARLTNANLAPVQTSASVHSAVRDLVPNRLRTFLQTDDQGRIADATKVWRSSDLCAEALQQFGSHWAELDVDWQTATPRPNEFKWDLVIVAELDGDELLPRQMGHTVL